MGAGRPELRRGAAAGEGRESEEEALVLVLPSSLLGEQALRELRAEAEAEEPLPGLLLRPFSAEKRRRAPAPSRP